MNWPNLFTCLRIVVIPVFFLFYYFPSHVFSPFYKDLILVCIFLLASVTDWLDGYLARRLDQVSRFGAFFDPVADKLLVVAALVILIDSHRINALLAFIIIGREIAISALREWMSSIGQGRHLAVSLLGKMKTTVQFIAIACLLFHRTVLGIFSFEKIGILCAYCAAVLTLLSMLHYLKRAWYSFSD